MYEYEYDSGVNSYDDDIHYFGTETADSWLEKYSRNPIEKYPSDKVLSDLLKLYPADSDMKIYRGLNFSTEEQWLSFKEKVVDKKILKIIQGVESFSSSLSVARQFATTKPMYLDFSTSEQRKELQKDLKYQKDKSERYSGHIGVIIGIKAPKEKIIDVNKSKYRKENEYLLTPGEYPLFYIKIVSKFKDLTDNPRFNIDNYFKKLNIKNLLNNKFINFLDKNEYLIKDETKHYLFNKLVKQVDFVNVDYKIYENRVGFFYDQNIHILIAYKDFWLNEDLEILKSKCELILKKIYFLIVKNKLYDYTIVMKNDISFFELNIDKSSEFASKIKKQMIKSVSDMILNINPSEINKIKGRDQMEYLKQLGQSIEDEYEKYRAKTKYKNNYLRNYKSIYS